MNIEKLEIYELKELKERIENQILIKSNQKIKAEIYKINQVKGYDLSKFRDVILSAIDKELGIGTFKILGTRRDTSIVEARYIAYAIIKHRNRYITLKEIAACLSEIPKHHTTIIHGLQNFEYFIETDKRFKEKYLKVIERIKVIENESKEMQNM
jgi:chromosomal replication initiation ATPase DnaA